MDRSNHAGRNSAALLVFALFASLIGAVRVWQSPASGEAQVEEPTGAAVATHARRDNIEFAATSAAEVPQISVVAVPAANPPEASEPWWPDSLQANAPAARQPSPGERMLVTALATPLFDDFSPLDELHGGAGLAENIDLLRMARDEKERAYETVAPTASMTPLPPLAKSDIGPLLSNFERVAVDGVQPDSAAPHRPLDPAALRILMNQQTDVVQLDPPSRQSRPLPPPRKLQQSQVPAPVVSATAALTWPEPASLIAQIQAIQAPHASNWRQQTVYGLRSIPNAGANRQQLQQTLTQLEQLSRLAEPLARKCSDPDQARAIRSTGYGLVRRLQVWMATLRATSAETNAQVSRVTSRDLGTLMQDAIAQGNTALGQSSHRDAWFEFLMINELNAVSRQAALTDGDARMAIAGTVLDRMLNTDLSPEQKQFLAQPSLTRFRQALHAWCTTAVDGRALLIDMESLEQSSSIDDAQAVANHWAQLKHSAVPTHRELARVIDHHYRNANVRISASEEFLNRLLPAIQNVRAPVREMILGAEVLGQSDSSTQVQVNLLPDEEQIRAEIRGHGHLKALTDSYKGPVRIKSRNKSDFWFRKMLTIDGESINVGKSDARASARTNMLGLATNYDAFPIVGSIVRRMAIQKHFESKNVARRVLESKVAGQTKQHIDDQVQQQLANAQQQLRRRVLDPLDAMELTPSQLAMRSTEERMEMRGRLVADHQIGAYTPRPRGQANNIVELQIHQSAINNFLDQVQLEGRRGELTEVFRGVATDLGFGKMNPPEDIPEDVYICLAPQEPVRVDCVDGEVKLTVSVAALKAGRLKLRNFKVTAFYSPEINGIQCDLRRKEGGIHVQCKGRGALAVRGIFTKVFSINQPIPMVLPELAEDPRMKDLQLTEVVFRDGWVGVSVGNPPPPISTAHRFDARRR